MPLGTDSQGGRYVVSPLQVQIHRILRRLWLVVLIATLAVGGVVAVTLTQETSYTGKAALTIASQNRAPEQDAVLAQGYADYFNQESYQDVLAVETGLGAGATFAARTAASSPIVYVEATTLEPESAQTSAEMMARAFQEDVNTNLRADTQRTVAKLRDQVVAESGRLQDLGLSGDEVSLVTEQILSLQDRITEIQSDTSNQLKELQLNAGVSSSSPNLPVNVALGLVGGLIMGCLAALGLASFEKPLATSYNLRREFELRTLATVGRTSGRSGEGRLRLQGLANIVVLSDLDRPTVVSVTSAWRTASSALVSRALASNRALQGERTVLLETDLARGRRSDVGVANFLSAGFNSSLDDIVPPGWRSGMLVVPAGTTECDPYALFTRERFADLVTKATDIADLVVVESPPLLSTPESQVINAGVHRTILVVDEQSTTMADVGEAVELLDQAGAVLLGAVVVQGSADDIARWHSDRSRENEPLEANRSGALAEPGHGAARTHVPSMTETPAQSGSHPQGSRRKKADDEETVILTTGREP